MFKRYMDILGQVLLEEPNTDGLNQSVLWYMRGLTAVLKTGLMSALSLYDLWKKVFSGKFT